MGRYGEEERIGRPETETDDRLSLIWFSFFVAPYSLLLPINLPDWLWLWLSSARLPLSLFDFDPLVWV
jgi:hypothetical protein